MGTVTGTATTTGTGPTTESATTTGSTDTRPVTEPAPAAVDRFLDSVNTYNGNMVVGISSVGVGASGAQVGFDPAAIKVATGTTVTWEWVSGGERHSVTSVDSVSERRAFSSGPKIGAGTTYRHTFERPGIYRYICGIHRTAGARGVVVVAPGSDIGGSGRG